MTVPLIGLLICGCATSRQQPTTLGTDASTAAVGTTSGRLIEIGVIEGLLKYDKDRLLVQPGEKVSLRFKNIEEMPHNLLICAIGTDIKKVADAALALGADGLDKQYLPEMPEILWATPLVMEFSNYTLNFTAPTKPGEYPYVCSFPGHYVMMNGILQVGGKLPKKTPLTDVNYKYYTGSWKTLPDFSALKPAKTGTFKDNLVDVNAKGFAKDNYGLVATATLHVPKTGKYTITAGSDDGGRILIDGKKVWEHDGTHGVVPSSKKVDLTAGAHPVEVQFFELTGGNEFRIAWKGPGVKSQAWSKGGGPTGGSGGPIIIEPTEKPVIYRDFFSKAGSRGIGIGYPEGVNALFDANYCRWMQIWRDDFIDAKIHWVGRGKGTTQPLDESAVDLFHADPIAFLKEANEKWPTRQEFKGDLPGAKSGTHFDGYLLDEKGRPTMLYHNGSAEFADSLEPVEIGSKVYFKRTLTITSKTSLDGLHVFGGRAREIKREGKGAYSIGDDLHVEFKLKGFDPPVIRPNDDGFDLVLPIKRRTKKASIEELIQW